MPGASTVGRRRLRRAETLTAALLDAPSPSAARRIDRQLALLSRRWGDGYLAAGRARRSWRAALADVDALAAAHVVARAVLPSAITASLVDDGLTAWCFGISQSELDERAPAHQRTPEILLGTLAARPAAAHAVLAGWECEALDLLLGWDPGAVGPFLGAAINGYDGVHVGELLGGVFASVWLAPCDACRAGASGERLVTWLARVVAPWQLHLVAASPGWDWTRPDPLDVLRWIASDEAGGAILDHASLRC